MTLCSVHSRACNSRMIELQCFLYLATSQEFLKRHKYVIILKNQCFPMGNKSLKIGKYPTTIDTDGKNLMVSFLLLAAPVKEIVCD